jgi:hypothetical protein
MRTRSLAWVCLIFVVLALQRTEGASAQPLKFFKNYFVTGDYTVRGISLWKKGVNGKAVANIPRLDSLGGENGIPATADIVAAFLYLQTAERVQGSGVDFGGVHLKVNGIDLGPFYAPGSNVPGSGTFAKAVVEWNDAPEPCWVLSFPGQRRLVTYRADVMRFLPIDPITKKQALNVPMRIEAPDIGRLFGADDDINDDEKYPEKPDWMGPRAIGASLVVVFRDDAKPFTGIVLVDGATPKRVFAQLDQTLSGFYEASLNKPIARMTHIVGNGRLIRSEKVVFGSQSWINPYVGAAGPRWDNTTFSSLKLPGGAASGLVSVQPYSFLPSCVQFSAMVFSTTVEDPDHDGLISVWETTPNLTDPNGLPLPDLSAMGADPNQKDLFAQIDWLETQGDTTYGDKVKPVHSHKPPEEAVTMLGDEYARNNIHLHLDVGNNYQSNPYVIKVGEGAIGGRSWSETAMCPDPTDDPENPSKPPIECGSNPIPGQYPRFPGTIGWKSGFRLMRDEVLGFASNRRQMMRYVLAGHFVGIPKDSCLKKNAAGQELYPPQMDQACVDASADFHVPRTYSGIGDYPGGDVYHALGGFDNELGQPVGTIFMWASTLMHEWGHTFKLEHGGRDPATGARLQNCRPQHFSVMNYMYQLVGVQKNDAKALLRYAEGVTDTIPENPLQDSVFNQTQAPVPYRMGFYAPKRSSNAARLVKAATKHCDGSDLSPDELTDLNNPDGFGGMVRLNAVTAEGRVDWNANGSFDSAGLQVPPNAPVGFQDIDFSGVFETLAGETNEWARLRLNEVGARRNVGGYYRDAQGRNAVGPMSLDVGRGDIGRGDIGRGDIGRGDIGRGDIGRGDIGRGDIGRGDIGLPNNGRGDIGRGDIGRGDIGRGGGDTDVGSVDEPFVELDEPTARAVTGGAPDPPSGLAACLTDDGVCASEGGGGVPVLLTWDAPHFGQILAYKVYRFEYSGEFAQPAALPSEAIATVTPFCEGNSCTNEVPRRYYDNAAPFGKQLAYFVTAVSVDLTSPTGTRETGISNFATVTTPAALDFEGFADLTVISDQYGSQGVTFTGATILNAGFPPYNSALFPPRSGKGVLFDWDLEFGGTMTATFTTPVTRVGGYVTGNTVITLTCFDGTGNSLGSASLPGANYVGSPTGLPPNILLEVRSPGIARCTFTDHGNSYTVDDFFFKR